MIFAIMALGVIMTGYFHYKNYERVFRMNVENQLSSIAALKAGELALWRKERLGDGAILFKNRNFSGLVRQFLENPDDTDTHKQLQEWMVKYTQAYQYAQVTLFDAHGSLRLLEPEDGNLVDLEISSNIPQILRDGKVVFQDFHREGTDSPVHLGVVVPIFDEADERRPLGVFLMDIDPTDYLYPFIAQWPTPSQTAETLLVRRDGDDALFLNEIRFKTHTPLTLRIPLAKTEVPAVKAVLGQTGTEEGVDYIGTPVIANVSAVPNSPWRMVSKISTAEAYAPVRERLGLTFILASVMLSGAGVAMWLIWLQRNARYQEREVATEVLRKAEEELRRFFNLVPDMVCIASTEGRFLKVNPMWEATLGYTEQEILSMPFLELIHPDDRSATMQEVERQIAGGATVGFVNRYLCKDGSYKWLEWMAMPSVEKTLLFAAARDITERKLAEEALRKSENKYRTLVENIPQSIFYKDRNSVYVSCNKNYADYLKIGVDEIAGKTDFDLHPKEFAEKYIADDQRLMGLGQTEEIEERYLEDGQEKWAYTVKTPIRDDSGAVIGILGIFWDITERKVAEETLRLHSDILRNLSEGVYLIRVSDGVIVFANERFESMFGYDSGECIGKHVSAVNAPSEKSPNAVANEIMEKLLLIGTWEGEVQNIKKDGSVFWCHANVSAFNHPQFGPVWVSVHEDITERKRVEEELRRSAQLLAEAQKVAKIGHWEWDINTGSVTWSDEMFRIFGYEPGAITPSMSALMDTVPPEDKERVSRIIDNALYGEGRYFMDRVAVLPDGTMRTVHAEGEVEHDESGAPIRMLAVAQDVTERKKAENSVKLFREALNLSSDSIIVLDTETARPVDFNPAAYERLGYTRAEMLALTVFNIIVAEPGEFSWKDRVRQVKESGGLIVERKHRKKDGSMIPVETSLSVAEVDGKEYLVAVVRDMTERVKMREMEITAKSLEIANRELEDFAHVASHDLQEPLRTIIAFSDRLEAKFGTEFNPKALDYLRRIRAAGTRMSRLMQDMLSYSLVSGGQLNFERVDASQVVATVLEDLRGSIEESGARFDIGPLPIVNADISQLRQLLQNLISNSIKYRKPGQPPTIKIGGTKTPMWDRGAMWEVVVEDDGIGFNNEHAQKIFKIFERLHGHSEYEGTGVGLATVSKIVQRHGWTIKAEGKPGEGAKFTILMVSFEE
ncbi:MAG: PAS domain S-box protein [Nitrospinae bacterium]|nr:PAS domain S-box protein [Nitrospinota bacterium]